MRDEFIEYVHAPNAHLGTVLLVRDEPDAVTLTVMITQPTTELSERRDVDSLETIDGAVHLIHRPNPGIVSRNMHAPEWFQSPPVAALRPPGVHLPFSDDRSRRLSSSRRGSGVIEVHDRCRATPSI